MKNIFFIILILLTVSCNQGQLNPPKQVDLNTQSNSGKKQNQTNSNARTTCEICSNFTIPPCVCGGNFGGTFNTLGTFHRYPIQTATICPNTTRINIVLEALDVPNEFQISFLDRNGVAVNVYNSGWMGNLNFPGRWGWSPPFPGSRPNTQSTSFTTTAQTTQWPCPFVYPGSSAVYTYQNNTGTPVNGVTWGILSNNPAGSASLIGNGALSQTVSFSPSFTSLQLQANTNDPSTGGYQNCQNIINISVPVLSNIVAVRIDVATQTPTQASGINPNTDRWGVSVSCTQNTSGSQCPSCY